MGARPDIQKFTAVPKIPSARLNAEIRKLVLDGTHMVTPIAAKLGCSRTLVSDRLKAMEAAGTAHRKGPAKTGGPETWFLGPRLDRNGNPILPVVRVVEILVVPEPRVFETIDGRDFFVAALFGAPKQSAPRCVCCGSSERHTSVCRFVGAA